MVSETRATKKNCRSIMKRTRNSSMVNLFNFYILLWYICGNSQMSYYCFYHLNFAYFFDFNLNFKKSCVIKFFSFFIKYINFFQEEGSSIKKKVKFSIDDDGRKDDKVSTVQKVWYVMQSLLCINSNLKKIINCCLSFGLRKNLLYILGRKREDYRYVRWREVRWSS